MLKNTEIGPSRGFEEIKKLDENGIEYWEARELMHVLEYSKWKNFEAVIKKAQQAALNSGQTVDNHFADVGKLIKVGYNTAQEIRDFKLSRYACYLIAQNGDSSKKSIALAQTYFAIQTRENETLKGLADTEKRLLIRSETKNENRKLFSTAKKSGVSNFGLFNDAGYKGLYGMSLLDLEKKKGIKKGELLDRVGSTELAANLFRITQTEEKLRQDNIKGEKQASNTHRMVGGKIRDTIKKIGGTVPENLPTQKHIKEVAKELKALGSRKKKVNIKRIPKKKD